MDEMYNVENEAMNEELTPVEENDELVSMEEEAAEPASNGTLGTVLILGATAVAGYVVGTKVVPGIKTGAKKAVGGAKNLLSKRKKSKKSKKDENSENVVEADCKEVETPEEKEDVEEG